LLTCYSPVRRSCTPKGLTARLACVKHAASVRPEPGSNSPLKSCDTSRTRRQDSEYPGKSWHHLVPSYQRNRRQRRGICIPRRLPTGRYCHSSTFGTLLSSQGSSAHRCTPLRRASGQPAIIYPGLQAPSNRSLVGPSPDNSTRPRHPGACWVTSAEGSLSGSHPEPAARPLGLASRRTLATGKTLRIGGGKRKPTSRWPPSYRRLRRSDAWVAAKRCDTERVDAPSRRPPPNHTDVVSVPDEPVPLNQRPRYRPYSACRAAVPGSAHAAAGRGRPRRRGR
jgi:hypothetical protein